MAVINQLPGLDFSFLEDFRSNALLLPGGGGGNVTLPWPTGGPQIGTPVINIGGGGGKTTTPPAKSSGIEDVLPPGTGTLLSCLANPSGCLLRILFIILGLICIAGAIYLYKPTSELIAAPVRAAKDATVTAVKGAAVA